MQIRSNDNTKVFSKLLISPAKITISDVFWSFSCFYDLQHQWFQPQSSWRLHLSKSIMITEPFQLYKWRMGPLSTHLPPLLYSFVLKRRRNSCLREELYEVILSSFLSFSLEQYFSLNQFPKGWMRFVKNWKKPVVPWSKNWIFGQKSVVLSFNF